MQNTPHLIVLCIVNPFINVSNYKNQMTYSDCMHELLLLPPAPARHHGVTKPRRVAFLSRQKIQTLSDTETLYRGDVVHGICY